MDREAGWTQVEYIFVNQKIMQRKSPECGTNEKNRMCKRKV